MSSLYYRAQPVEKYKYVVTIAVFSHGLTTTLNLTPAIAELMDNVRMYSITSKFGSSLITWATGTHGTYAHVQDQSGPPQNHNQAALAEQVVEVASIWQQKIAIAACSIQSGCNFLDSSGVC